MDEAGEVQRESLLSRLGALVEIALTRFWASFAQIAIRAGGRADDLIFNQIDNGFTGHTQPKSGANGSLSNLKPIAHTLSRANVFTFIRQTALAETIKISPSLPTIAITLHGPRCACRSWTLMNPPVACNQVLHTPATCRHCQGQCDQGEGLQARSLQEGSVARRRCL
jgi:hypothetical protein